MKTTVHRVLRVPIYDAIVYLTVAKDVVKARAALNKTFGEVQGDDFQGICSTNGGNKFSIVIPFKASCGLIAHEVFHLTHFILDWSNVHFTADDDEAGALLHGYLMEWVSKQLSK